YQPDFGLINYLLSAVGLRPVDWLGSPRTALLAVMIVSVWVQFGYQISVFLAGLQGVPEVYLDAARVDGAGAWQRFRRITLALIAGVTIVPFLYMIATALTDQFAVLRYPPPLVPARPHPENFAIALTALPFARFFLNTALFAGCVVVGQVATSAMAAYAFARL